MPHHDLRIPTDWTCRSLCPQFLQDKLMYTPTLGIAFSTSVPRATEAEVLKNPIISVCVGAYAPVARQRMPTPSAHSASVNRLHSDGKRIANGREPNEDGEFHVPMADSIGSRIRGGERSLARDEPALESTNSFSSNSSLVRPTVSGVEWSRVRSYRWRRRCV